MERGIFRGELDQEQRTIFAQILDGKTGREIAASLGTTPCRVERIVRNTRRQLDASSRHDAARIIARHLDWKTGPAVPFVGCDDGRQSHQYGKDSHRSAAKTVQTEREQSPFSGYVSDAGNPIVDQGNNTGAYSEIARGLDISEFLTASPVTRRLLLMAVLVASSSLTLGALISALQGLDMLMFS
ncbi:hypothetical protein [Sandarakinorhabdus sp. DWP1-3-1]|uniref:hypothetical protein n=1 Tax=Sandarakinorhabdus sp. DWP1-3-1 TaxID=2804627 RepID=UPI003CF2A1B5